MYTCKLTTFDHLLNQFKAISEIMIQQSILIAEIPYSELKPEEVEELEINEKGVSLIRFREYTSDILFATYLFL